MTVVDKLCDEQLVRWRADELERAGYPPFFASMLAALAHVDIHQATDLLAHGCPVETAVKILV